MTAGQLRADGVEAVSLAVDDSVFTGPAQGEGWEAEDVELCLVTPITALAVHRTTPAEVCVPDYDPAISAGRIFAELLNGFGIQVLGEVGRAAAPVGESEVLASVESAPMSAMVEQMVTDSDNVSAEMLAHLVGGEVVGEASFQGGARATLAALADLGVSSQGVTLLDGSGLSLLDLLPPRTASELLNVALNGANDQLWPMLTGLPVAGSTGTLIERFATPPTEPGRGDVRGKTGTLTASLRPQRTGRHRIWPTLELRHDFQRRRGHPRLSRGVGSGRDAAGGVRLRGRPRIVLAHGRTDRLGSGVGNGRAHRTRWPERVHERRRRGS